MKSYLLMLPFMLLFACASPVRPSPNSQTYDCRNASDCAGNRNGMNLCVKPGACRSGADQRPLGECPPERPYRIKTPCNEACSATPPSSCEEGFTCPYGGVCRPDAPGRDQHGCVRPTCTEDEECEAGFCVEGRCYDRPGTCDGIPE